MKLTKFDKIIDQEIQKILKMMADIGKRRIFRAETKKIVKQLIRKGKI